MQRFRPLWVRDLRLYRTGLAAGAALPDPSRAGPQLRFRSASDPRCFALYSMRDGSGPWPGPDAVSRVADDHALVVVREFRRVPLEASAISMLLFTADRRHAARVIAGLAHWAGRAVSDYQPTYLLLAHSLQQPEISVVLAAVHEGQALQAARLTPFSVDALLPEIRPWLAATPERYDYCPEAAERRLSPFPV